MILTSCTLKCDSCGTTTEGRLRFKPPVFNGITFSLPSWELVAKPETWVEDGHTHFCSMVCRDKVFDPRR